MIENIKISKAALSDLDSVLQLQRMVFFSEDEKPNDKSTSTVQSRDSVKSEFENFLFLKAESGKDIVGCVKAREKGEFCWIEKLAVAPQFQKMGIGSSLMAEVEKAFPDTRLYLLCAGTRPPENLDFYKSLGYKKRDLSKDGKTQSIFVKQVKQNLKS
jgi:N-acetylglutamate synthase-like GNAT family acetyltransferase